MSKDFYYQIAAIVNNIEDENNRILEIKKKEFLKTELEPIKENIKLNAQKYGKSMCVKYTPPDYIRAKLLLSDIHNILAEELKGFNIGWEGGNRSHPSFVITYSGEAI